MPPKTNKEWVAEFGKLKALSMEDGSIKTNIRKCEDWLRVCLTAKDQEKEEAVAEARREAVKKVSNYKTYSTRFLNGTTQGVSKAYFYLVEKIHQLDY